MGKQDDRNKVSLKADDYDIAVKELAFEIKSSATDRLKTEEELAREAKEELERLERERKERMLGKFDADIDCQSADAILENEKKRDKRFEVSYKDGKMVLTEGMNLFPTESKEKSVDVDNESESRDDNGEDSEDGDDF